MGARVQAPSLTRELAPRHHLPCVNKTPVPREERTSGSAFSFRPLSCGADKLSSQRAGSLTRKNRANVSGKFNKNETEQRVEASRMASDVRQVLSHCGLPYYLQLRQSKLRARCHGDRFSARHFGVKGL